ncbi:MAG: NADH-quinone oxidoreductase subunit L [Acidimicrobiales bacterium]|nr:NADH-quinone oxidoreductase subunit L [Acidimicrobiales bacterium]
MTNDPAALPLWHAIVLAAPTLAALVAVACIARARTLRQAWRMAGGGAAVMVAAAIAALALHAGRYGAGQAASTLLRSDPAGVAMLLLVGVVGWVVIRYSRAYLAGEAHLRSYLTRLLLTLAAVTMVTTTNHLVVLAVAWTATSLALHGLLTFYAERPEAIAAAPKKFLFARGADLCMAGAVLASIVTFDTLRIDELMGRAAEAGWPVGGRVIVALVAVAVLLKCAQLPFHGWLIQVMEAPTPVSALLHAGVVNLGGFVLLRFAPLVDHAPETRTLLVGVGAATATIAALVMSTRISVKVALAWSTTAQLGFMIMQAGLGLWAMVLLHLLGHSLYKAHAFLSAAGVVEQIGHKQLAPAAPRPTAAAVLTGTALCLAGTVAAAAVWSRLPFAGDPSPERWVLSGIVALAVVPLVLPGGLRSVAAAPAAAAAAVAVPLAYLGLHDLFDPLVPHGTAPAAAHLLAVAIAFGLLHIVHWQRVLAPNGRLATRLYPWLYGGLFLDEALTRRLFAWWPPAAPAVRPALLPSARPTAQRPASGAVPARTLEPSGVVPIADRSFA